jgi:hypothetical protein
MGHGRNPGIIYPFTDQDEMMWRPIPKLENTFVVNTSKYVIFGESDGGWC